MQEVLRTNDMFRISLVRQLLEDNAIFCSVFDIHSSIALPGNMVAQRLMVLDEDFEKALKLIRSLEDEHS